MNLQLPFSCTELHRVASCWQHVEEEKQVYWSHMCKADGWWRKSFVSNKHFWSFTVKPNTWSSQKNRKRKDKMVPYSSSKTSEAPRFNWKDVIYMFLAAGRYKQIDLGSQSFQRRQTTTDKHHVIAARLRSQFLNQTDRKSGFLHQKRKETHGTRKNQQPDKRTRR